MKKIFALILTLTLLIALASGCAGSQTPTPEASAEAAPAETSAPVQSADPAESAAPTAEAAPEEPVSMKLSEELVTITCWDTWPPFFATFDGDFQTPADTYLFKAMEELLNVHLELTVASTETASEQFNLMVAGGEYRDLLYGVSGSYTGGIDQAIEDEVIIDLYPHLAEIPNYAAAIESEPGLKEDLLSEGGALGGFASIYKGGTARKTGALIRGDWLEDLNMEVPTTVDQLHDALKAFKDEKGATAALWLCASNNGQASAISTAYAPNGYYLDDSGNIQYSTDVLEDYYGYMANLYAEGLVPVDFLSYIESHKPLNSLVDTGLCGVIEDDYDNYKTAYQSVNQDPNCEFVPMPDLVLNEGDKIEYYTPSISYEGNEYCSVSTDCQLLDIVLPFMDYCYSEDGYMLANYGVEGVTFEFDADGTPIFTDLIANNQYGIPIALANMIYLTGCWPHLRDFGKLDYALSDTERSCSAVWDSQRAEVGKGIPNAVTMSADEQTEADTLQADIDTFFEEGYLTFFTGAKPMSEFKSWLDGFYDIFGDNIERIIELRQAAYDRYLEKKAK